MLILQLAEMNLTVAGADIVFDLLVLVLVLVVVGVVQILMLDCYNEILQLSCRFVIVFQKLNAVQYG